ncbi:MAG: hypothetical protein J6M93_06900 [Succinivibrio sp.]|nr:hypothetical protein [Succinivibrio sp.]
MLDHIPFKEEAQTLVKWLIAIPSISGTAGENILINAVYEGISEFNYFRKHPHNLRYIQHSDGTNHSIIALVKSSKNEVRDTIIIQCNTDTSGNDSYGMLKSLAFKSDELKERLKLIITDKYQKKSLNDKEQIYGLGSYENKFSTGALIVFLKDCSDHVSELPVNLLFVCASNSINGHQGIRACLGPMDKIRREYDLDYKIAVSFAHRLASEESKRKLYLYTANPGLIEVYFYIIGQGASQHAPYSGFSPSLVASKLIQKIELNPKFISKLTKKALVPSFRCMNCYGKRAPNSPDSVQLGFSIPFVNLSFSELLDELKETAAQALEESALNTDDRQTYYESVFGHEFEPDIRNAEVMSFSDLFYKAKKHYRDDLASALDALLLKCIKDGFNQRRTAQTIIERLNDLAHLPKPSIVVYFGNNFVPQQSLSQKNPMDRELYIRLDKTVQKFNSHHDSKIEFSEEYLPTDACFIRPIGIDQCLKVLSEECPVPVNTFYNLGAPSITLSLNGEDLYEATEHSTTDNFEIIGSFLESLFLNLTDNNDEEIRNKVIEQEQTIKAVMDNSEITQQAAPESKLPLNSDSKEGNKEQTENTDKDTDAAREKQTSAKEPDNPKSQS